MKLKDEANVEESQLRQSLFFHGRRVLVRHNDVATGGRIDAANEIEQSGLSAAGRPRDGGELAGPKRETHVPYGVNNGVAEVVVFADVGQLHNDTVGTSGRFDHRTHHRGFGRSCQPTKGCGRISAFGDTP